MCDFRGIIGSDPAQDWNVKELQTPKSKITSNAKDQKVSMGDFGLGTFDSNPFDVSETPNLKIKKQEKSLPYSQLSQNIEDANYSYNIISRILEPEDKSVVHLSREDSLEKCMDEIQRASKSKRKE
jgi:hypothetical protein